MAQKVKKTGKDTGESRIEVLKDVFISPRIIETRLGTVEIDITEGDGPVLLGSHGGLGGIDQCRAAIDFAGKDFRLLSLSRPGYLNTPLESGKTLDEQADLFAAVLDELGIDRVAVFSISAGGPFAYTFAIRHPDRIWALITADSVSGYYDLPETAGPLTQMIFLSDTGQRLLQKMTKARPDAFIKEIFRSEAYYTKEQMKKHLDFVMNDPYAYGFATAFMNTMYPYKPRKAGTENDVAITRTLSHLPVEEITCPTLVIHGTHDADVKLYDGVYAYEHIENAERIWIEEGSHLCFWINPKSKEAQLYALEFLKRHMPK
ncbi:alpha/beta hydrolase [Methanoculleus sp. FWC-SCC1]|uniref:Alpha/beta hydrolase n=1 Tax=Methanoculleus frigidifontis TaxID=2584085 RepID=A0ABT8ME65_9EURY|nr:alpha/beta hydrolase [Methanoculleus sp. FWC-SCC1]MDN7026204.1 alpha/beta hydrolase [Methanoculleus sp. FWC-SCC1]